jgi:Xaa-Pro aminopeptidase
MAHHKPNGRTLQPGDPIIIDMGAELNGYKSDLTRTFHLGPHPSDQFWQIYNLVHAAQKTALAQMRAGVNGKAIDALARDLITAAGHGDHFGHSLGHGVGLDIHETPRLTYLTDEEIIPAGAVITVEPGVYLPGWGGVRIEDLVLFTETGVELLSHCPKDPIISTSI